MHRDLHRDLAHYALLRCPASTDETHLYTHGGDNLGFFVLRASSSAKGKKVVALPSIHLAPHSRHGDKTLGIRLDYFRGLKWVNPTETFRYYYYDGRKSNPFFPFLLRLLARVMQQILSSV